MDTKRLRDLREDNDKTQQQIADMLNMHRSVYRRYESGEREIPVWGRSSSSPTTTASVPIICSD